jgi:hypothetical protein
MNGVAKSDPKRGEVYDPLVDPLTLVVAGGHHLAGQSASKASGQPPPCPCPRPHRISLAAGPGSAPRFHPVISSDADYWWSSDSRSPPAGPGSLSGRGRRSRRSPSVIGPSAAAQRIGGQEHPRALSFRWVGCHRLVNPVGVIYRYLPLAVRLNDLQVGLVDRVLSAGGRDRELSADGLGQPRVRDV